MALPRIRRRPTRHRQVSPRTPTWHDVASVDFRKEAQVTGREPRPEDVRAIPLGGGEVEREEGWGTGGADGSPAGRNVRRPDDDAYVVDTRRKARRPPARAVGRPPGPAPAAAGSSDVGAPDGPVPPRRRRRRGRRAALVLVLLLIAWVGFMVWVPFAAWNKVAKVDNSPAGQRPADSKGFNYLLVGSDSREGLSAQQQKELSTGSDVGKRTDSIMLVHVSASGGKPAIISIPRDSYVPIPGYGSNKINASFSFAGAKLLTTTVEQVTGIHVDGYVEIGFGGFASIVDSLGGVDICVATDMVDPLAGINLKAGCQTLNGPNSLGYVRSRHEDPLGDIGRGNRQRQFLGAVMKKAVTPSTILVPWRYKGFADAAAGGLTVGDTTSLRDAVRVLQAMRSVSSGDGLSLTVPIESTSLQTRNAGVAVKWSSEQAKALFTALKNDDPLSVPPAGTTPAKAG